MTPLQSKANAPLITSDNSNSEHSASDDPYTRHLIHSMDANIESPCHLTLSSDSIDNTIGVPLKVKGTHPTLGMITKNHANTDRIRLLQCQHSTPAVKIPRWCSMLWQGYVTAYNYIAITSITHLQSIITSLRKKNEKDAIVTFTTVKKQSMHPVPGVPQMYHEQLNVVACHLQDIKWDCQLQQQINGSGAILPSVAKLNRHNL